MLIAGLEGIATGRNSGARATVTGGADGTGHEYAWTVHNHHTTGVVSVRIPHYRANLFRVPSGWKGECTNLVQVGAKDRPGECVASILTGETGIKPGTSVEFRVQIAAGGARRTRGGLLVGFADGLEITVGGVEVPGRESFGDRYVPLIGLAAIFGVWITVRAFRKRRRALMAGDSV